MLSSETWILDTASRDAVNRLIRCERDELKTSTSGHVEHGIRAGDSDKALCFGVTLRQGFVW